MQLLRQIMSFFIQNFRGDTSHERTFRCWWTNGSWNIRNFSMIFSFRAYLHLHAIRMNKKEWSFSNIECEWASRRALCGWFVNCMCKYRRGQGNLLRLNVWCVLNLTWLTLVKWIHFLEFIFNMYQKQIIINQEQYLKNVLKKFGMSDCKQTATQL